MKKFLILIFIALVICGCGAPNYKNNTVSNDSVVIQRVDIFDQPMVYKQLDSILCLGITQRLISSQDSTLIKQYICNSLYDSIWNRTDKSLLSYKEIMDISHTLQRRIDSLNQSSRVISFPFQLGESVTIPQIITFGSRKDVVMTEHYEDVYSSPTPPRKFLYKKHLGNDLDELKSTYNQNRRKYYWYTKDSTFIYKYFNCCSFDFTKSNIDYDTYLCTYGGKVMNWTLSYYRDIQTLYREKYGEPLFMNSDTTFLCWDFKNIRLEIVYDKESWLKKRYIYFKHKPTYREWQQHSKIVEARENQARLNSTRAAQKKEYNDSIRTARNQKLDL